MSLRLNCFFFRTFVVLSLGLIGLLSGAFGQTPSVTYLNIGLGYSAADTNTMPFASYSVTTAGNYQFVTYYNTLQHATIARRQLGTTTWSITDTGFTANAISDDHDMISMGIDGNGIMHISWGMHNNPLKYTTSTASVLNNNSINFNSSMVSSMPISAVGGGQSAITYPQFYNIPGSGDLLFWYRTGGAGGGSGNGNLNLNRYSAATGTWSEVKGPLLDGITNSVNAYPNTMVINNQGTYEISWTWRANANYQSNSNVCYAQSTDGTTWTSITGAAINSGSGAITLNSPNQVAVSIPQNSSLMNQTSMTNDLYGRPMIATFWAPGGNVNSSIARQYELVYYNGSSWQTSQITNRPTELRIDNNDSTKIREMGRPVVLSDQDDRTLVVVRYNEDSTTGTKDIFGTTNRNNIIVYYSTDKQHWNYLDLTPGTDMGFYEANYDPAQWKQNGILDLFYQQVPSGTNTTVKLLEWNWRSYFITNTTWDWAGGNSACAADSAANWKVNTYAVTHAPNGAGYNFSFGNESAANNVMDIPSGGLTVGDITFTAGTSTTIQSVGGYSLTLDNLGSSSLIAVAGSHTISAPVLLNNDVNISGTGTLNLSGGISGPHGMAVLSGGNVTAQSILLDTVTLGIGARITIQPIPGGPLGGDLVPVPEPSTLVTLAIGALFAIGYGWRRRSRSHKQ